MSIGERLREFGVSKYGNERGWVNQMSADCGISASALSQYLSNKRIPGNKMQARLRELGCDVQWLMTGLHKAASPDFVPTKHEIEMIMILRDAGISSKRELQNLLDPDIFVNSVADVIREKMYAYKSKRKQ